MAIKFLINSIHPGPLGMNNNGNAIKIGGYAFSLNDNSTSGTMTLLSNQTITPWEAVTVAIKNTGIDSVVSAANALKNGSLPTSDGYTFDYFSIYCTGGANLNKSYKATSPTSTFKQDESPFGTCTLHDGETYLVNFHWTKTGGSTPTPTQYTVTFNDNYGSGGPGTQTRAYGGTINLSQLSKPTRSGFTHIGWNRDITSQSVVYGVNATITVTGNDTLYAVWEQEGSGGTTSGTITLYPNGGTIGSADTYWWKLSGGVYKYSPPMYDDVSLPAITRSGYNFAGWKDSSGNIQSHIIYTGGDYSFTAQWTSTTTTPPSTGAYTITVKANGGTFSTANAYGGTFSDNNTIWKKSVSYNTVVTLPVCSPRSGYYFDGYSVSGALPQSITQYTVMGNVTLLAVWKQGSAPLDEKPGAPIWVTGTVEVYPDSWYDVTWRKPATGGDPTYYDLREYDTNVPNFAIGLVDLPAYTGAATQSYSVRTPGPGKKKYFYISAGNSEGMSAYAGPATLIGQVIIDPNPPAKIMLTFSGGRVHGIDVQPTNMPTPNPREVDKNSTFKLPAEEPKFTGATFLGWCENLTGGTTIYPADSYYTIGFEPVTLHAIWDIIRYNVTFDPSGGTIDGSSTGRTYSYIYNESYNSNNNNYKVFPQAKRNGYEFLGWFTSKTGGTQVKETDKCTGTLTLYAHWKDEALAPPVWTSANVKVKRGDYVRIAWRKSDYNDTRAHQYEILDTSTGKNIHTGYISKTEWDFVPDAYFTGTTLKVRAVYKTSSGSYIYSDWSEPLTVSWDKGSAPMRPGACYINASKQPPTIYSNITTFDEYKYYDVSWTSVSDPDGDLEGYKLEYSVFDGTNWSDWKQQPDVKGDTKAQYLSSGLSGWKQVKYRVAGFDKLGNVGEWRESTPVTISTKRPPTKPGRIWFPDQSHLPSSMQNGIVEATKEFKICWDLSTDPDGDLAGYRLERRIDDGDWKYCDNPYPNITYAYDSVPWKTKTVEYRVRAYDTLELTSEWTYSEKKNVLSNTPPSTPAWINVPHVNPNETTNTKPIPDNRPKASVKAGEPMVITWEASTDAENNLEGYELQRSLDGGTWTTIAKPDTNFYEETIDKTHAFHSSVIYRVRAYDNAGPGIETLYSNWCTSDTYNVSNNSSPIVTTNYGDGEYLGVLDQGFSFSIKVTDEENDYVDVEVAIVPEGATEDGKIVLGTFTNRATPLNTVYTLTDEDFQALPMQRFTVVITAKDAEGYGRTSFSFTRRATRAFVTLKQPITYPEFINAVRFTRLLGSFPSDCIMKVEVTNNANDREGTVKWEECTAYARDSYTYHFVNKIAWRPAFNFRITLNRGPSGAGGYLSRVSGYFITENTEQQF